MRLVLWDIDGTLVDTAPHGSDAFAQAFHDVTGRRPERLAAMAGRTDHEIALDILEGNGVADGERHLPDFTAALAAALAGREAAIRAEGRELPGARAALAALDREPGVVQSLLTGNIEPNAALKLGAFGLGAELDFALGGYGSDDRVRANLVAVARRRAEARAGEAVAPADTVLIGDTPLDVAAGRAAGARVVAVASGRSSVPELTEAGADAVLADLCDTEAVVAAVMGRAER